MAGEFLKPLGKVERGVEIEQVGDIADGQIGFTQEALDAFITQLSVILLGTESGVFLERSSEIGVAHVQLIGKGLDG